MWVLFTVQVWRQKDFVPTGIRITFDNSGNHARRFQGGLYDGSIKGMYKFGLKIFVDRHPETLFDFGFLNGDFVGDRVKPANKIDV